METAAIIFVLIGAGALFYWWLCMRRVESGKVTPQHSTGVERLGRQFAPAGIAAWVVAAVQFALGIAD